MMRFILLLVLVVMLSGCAATFQPPTSCVDTKSIILDVTDGNPSDLDRSLLIVNIAALEKGKYSADQAREFLTQARNRINNGISYVGLYTWLSGKTLQVNKAAGLAVIILGEDIPEISQLGGTLLLSRCDKELILAHIAKQESILIFY